MEFKTLTKNGKTVEYGIENNEVVVRDALTKQIIQKAPLKLEDIDAQGLDEFRTCMRGCYPLSHGNPLELAACIADCSTLIPT